LEHGYAKIAARDGLHVLIVLMQLERIESVMKVYVAESCETMPDGSLAFGFHRCNLIMNDPLYKFGAWVCQDCGKKWQADASKHTFNSMREDHVCNT
jgi:hypothetical protein